MAGKKPSPLLDALAGFAAHAAVALFRLLPPPAASELGGWIGVHLGPLILPRMQRTALRNLRMALPEKSNAERALIAQGVWRNLGRTLGEYPHLARIMRQRVEIIGLDKLHGRAAAGKPGLIFAAHLGNWELMCQLGSFAGLDITFAYRVPNNRWVRGLIAELRATEHLHLAPKGVQGARQLIAELQAGGTVGLLIDQKMNDGIEARFFGQPAMTAPAIAQFAQRFEAEILGLRVERLAGCRFRLTVTGPYALAPGPDRHAAIAATVQRLNDEIEAWVRAHPEQWLWTHNRWPPQAVAGTDQNRLP